MSSQTHREPMEDGATKRREYLRRKAWLHLGVLGTTASLVFVAWGAIHERPSGHYLLVHSPLLILSCCVIVHSMQRSIGKIRNLDYVPPVHEQIAALPVNEILLRGAGYRGRRDVESDSDRIGEGYQRDAPTRRPQHCMNQSNTGLMKDASNK